MVFSELHYHPAPPTRTSELAISSDPDDFEFIELLNVGPTTVDFTGAHLADGVLFDFQTGYTLAPGARCVVVKNVAAFEARYGTGRAVAGTFALNGASQTGLSNGGENLSLTHTAGTTTTTLFSLAYDDIAPWPTSPDGGGPSLMLKIPAPNIAHSTAANWIASADLGGTPAQSPAQITFNNWRTPYNDALSTTGDDDGDGIPNALEYALALHPLVRNNNALPAPQLITDAGQPYLALTFRHRLGADLALVVETSDTLAAWDGPPSVVLVSSTDHGDGTFTATWRCATPSNGAAKQFLHIRATVAP